MDTGKPRATRGVSTSSSTSVSSTAETIRASSDRGRKRDSTAATPPGLFARLRGKTQEQRPRDGPAGTPPLSQLNADDEVYPEVGLSDYWQPPEAGPSDYWRASETDTALQDSPLGWGTLSSDTEPANFWEEPTDSSGSAARDNGGGAPSAPNQTDELDKLEFERRINDVRMMTRFPPTNTPPLDKSGSHTPNGSTTQTMGEEEFGALGHLDKDDYLDSTHPTSQLPAGPNPLRQTSYLHPSISRLRSHMRTTSSTTQDSYHARPSIHSRTNSHFSLLSVKSDSTSVSAVSRAEMVASVDQNPAFVFRPLSQLSAHLFRRGLGITPAPKLGGATVMDVQGVLAVGMSQGWTSIYGFDQKLRCVLGNVAVCLASGAVTSIKISSDDTYVAVGHATGIIHLYDLASPTKPARSTTALTPDQWMSGRREGHLRGSRVTHLGFVGARHTSIVSGDEDGRAFWWSLGRVMGVESTDVVRILGSYPEEADQTCRSNPSKRPSTLFAALPLPLGLAPHPTDVYNMTALLTPSKLVLVGMKPTAKTWFRKMRDSTGGAIGGYTGCAQWRRAGDIDGVKQSDPVLAYSWGTTVRLLHLAFDAKPAFLEGRNWESPEAVLVLEWFDTSNLIVFTSKAIFLLDVRTMTAIERYPLQTQLLAAQDLHSSLANKGYTGNIPDSIRASVHAHRERLFLLTHNNVQVGTLLHWNDQILAHVHKGDLLGAIHLALAYYEGRAGGNLMHLPAEPVDRRSVIGARIRELLNASLHWAFSEERMHDDTHYSVDGRGVDLTDMFENLATACIGACLSLDDSDLLSSGVYDRFAQGGIQNIFLSRLAPFIFDGRVRHVPPNINKSLIAWYEERHEYDRAEAIIWLVDPHTLDINQAIRVCVSHGLWDAAIHIYTRAMQDYVAPIVIFIKLIRQSSVDQAQNVTEPYKIFAFLESVLSGLSYPTREVLLQSEAKLACDAVYGFVFSGRVVMWPDGADGELVLASDNANRSYPYLDLLLHFDTEAFLHAMDIAFEDSYLNDSHGIVSRQSMVNLMLDGMDSTSFSAADITLLHIFVARNLPKYPQFLLIQPSTLHRIMVSLASDLDRSSGEDRQLAVEFLLSAYTPHDMEAMSQLFDQAGFFRILRTTYRRERKWTELASVLLRDPESDRTVFSGLDEIMMEAPIQQVFRVVSEACPRLLDLDVRQTALLLDRHIPASHSQAVDALASADHKQMVYLRCLLQPRHDDLDDGPLPALTSPSVNLDMALRLSFVNLLCRHDSLSVSGFLDEKGPQFFDLDRLAEFAARGGHFNVQLWALDRQGRMSDTLQSVGDILRGQGADLGEAMLANDQGSLHLTLQSLSTVTQMAIRLCQEHSDEDMWYGVLHDLVDLIHSIGPFASTDTEGEIQSHTLKTIRSLVQETLSALVSSSSQTSSLPRLFKRLIEPSTQPGKSAERIRAYSEFRTILSSMLESYRAEGDMLTMTNRLIEADLFIAVQDMTARRQRGWRPSMLACSTCGVEVTTSRISILGSGEVSHLTCPSVN